MKNSRMKTARRGMIPYWAHWVLATAILIGSGVLYRHLEPQWRGTGVGPIKLPVSLEEFPLVIGEWEGKKRTIAAITEEYMRRNFADDYFSHLYYNEQQRAVAGLYVTYCASRPAGILGHRPRVCYTGGGWIHDRTTESEFITKGGRTIACLVHNFHKPMPDYAETVVLNFYVVNGEIAINEDRFSGLMGRNPNMDGDPARYVAQVQVSGNTESSILLAASDLVDKVLEYLPDENGLVAVAPEYEPNELSRK